LDSTVPQLAYEFKVYRKLLGVKGVPIAFALWKRDELTNMAMQVLGPSLEKCMRRLTQWDVINWVCPKSIDVIEAVHGKTFLHRDIKPENILTGPGGIADRDIFLVDFGLCKRFRMQAHDHIPYKEGKRLTGTVRYASIHTHLGEEQSRRDDLESLGYVMVYLIKHRLPWMGVTGKDKKEQNDKIMGLKINTPFEELCQGLPPAFVQYFRHVRSLSFDQTPDYALLRSFFRNTVLK
jgi:casein kinase I family protein HRR25